MTTPVLSLPGEGDLPVVTAQDIIDAMPAELRIPELAAVRDAIAEALAESFKEYQDRSAYAAAQISVLRADGVYLQGVSQDRGTVTVQGELDSNLRRRMLTPQKAVTKNAILNEVNDYLDDYTDGEAQLFDSVLDRFFTQDGTTDVWLSFIGSNPSYLDRYYDDDIVINNGIAREQAEPGGAWVFGDGYGRYFVLRIPQLDGLEDQHAFILTGNGSFIHDGTNASGAEANGEVATFAFAERKTAEEIYRLTLATVERIKGHGIRWQLIVDSRLA